ncbi:MAG: hypothetical protein ABI629_18540, partial [bacterium]
GDYAKRDYTARHKALQSFAFDPSADLRADGDGCWEWASPKASLHEWVADYFVRRQEDGDAVAVSQP